MYYSEEVIEEVRTKNDIVDVISGYVRLQKKGSSYFGLLSLIHIQMCIRDSAYAGRKERKRQMRQLWIARINAAARMNGLSYSKFMHGLKVAGVDMNRKMLAELAVSDKEGFATLAELAKSRLA